MKHIVGFPSRAPAADEAVRGEVNMEALTMETEHKITVVLVSKAAVDLAKTHGRTELSQTDIINRAISLYEFLDQERDSGSEVLIRRRDGSTYLVELL
jgi:hypothetical protein